jgi:REP element-mobilizing transposase RayT
MPRANRHYIPGHAWHITHRCHKKEFLLKFAKDRQGWIDWLFKATRKRLREPIRSLSFIKLLIVRSASAYLFDR